MARTIFLALLTVLLAAAPAIAADGGPAVSDPNGKLSVEGGHYDDEQSFLARGSYSFRAAMALTIGGIPAVLIAAFLIKSLPLTWLRWLVFAVVLYTAFAMLRSARTPGTAATDVVER